MFFVWKHVAIEFELSFFDSILLYDSFVIFSVVVGVHSGTRVIRQYGLARRARVRDGIRFGILVRNRNRLSISISTVRHENDKGITAVSHRCTRSLSGGPLQRNVWSGRCARLYPDDTFRRRRNTRRFQKCFFKLSLNCARAILPDWPNTVHRPTELDTTVEG